MLSELNIVIHRTLISIQIFAKTCASRNFLTSMLRSGVDAEGIQEYREKLRQSMRVFGVSTFHHINKCAVTKSVSATASISGKPSRSLHLARSR